MADYIGEGSSERSLERPTKSAESQQSRRVCGRVRPMGLTHHSLDVFGSTPMTVRATPNGEKTLEVCLDRGQVYVL